jgi:hypothetical protein
MLCFQRWFSSWEDQPAESRDARVHGCDADAVACILESGAAPLHRGFGLRKSPAKRGRPLDGGCRSAQRNVHLHRWRCNSVKYQRTQILLDQVTVVLDTNPAERTKTERAQAILDARPRPRL